ncbi:CAP domain-containing protein [Alkalihalobacterium chitinilyticum]|uniref:CAP domain-containing protein n=1 Tax=Alkalihalobacterium chitinilyticum TaxID=2980103 RepID=A0ABT5VAW4_9BACI|nr:CAP domain-containing protein [Alkalihalobacterium chitinilyticum]MDE5412616.1 CAP domain-containing protein [Alkalihalobacterium chitinilyticum]
MKKILTTSFAALLMTSLFATGAYASTEKQTKGTTNYQVQVYSNTMNQELFDNLLKDLKSNRDLQSIIERIQATYPNVKVEPVKREPLQQNQNDTDPSKETIKVEQPEREQPKEAKPDQSKVNTPTTQQTNQSQPTQSSEQVQSGITAEEQQMVNLVNEERAKVGLPALKVNTDLTKVARVKAQDMIDHNYFAHQSPTYGSPFDMLQHYGVSYRTAGENLAGNQTVEAAHRALMNSSGHRANILNHQYTEVGIGIINGGPYGKMFVQLFKG